MNKFLLILMAVCLVSVHAFVKRDAPEAEKNENLLENLTKQFQDFSKDISSKLSDTFDADKIKQGLDQLNDSVKKALDDLKAKSSSDAKE